MSNTKISQLPSYTGTAADLRWFVMNNSGETTTYKYSGYSTSVSYGDGISSIKSTNANNSLGDYSVSIGDGASTLASNQISIGKNANSGGGSDASNSNAISIGTNSINRYNDTGCGGIAIGNEADADNFIRNSVAIGYRATAKVGGVSIGDQANFGFNGDAQVAIGCNSVSSADGSIAIGFGCDVRANNSTAVGRFSGILSGDYSVNIGAENAVSAERVVLIGAQQSVSSPYSTLINGVSNTLSSTGYYNNIFNGSGNTIANFSSYASIFGGNNNTIDNSNNSQVLGGKSNNLVSNDYSAIIGGTGNTMASSISSANGKGNYIINSRDCKVEKDGQYQSNNVNYIGCDNVRLENLNDVTFINVKNITAENGGFESGTTVMRNTYTLGASLFAADTYTATTITINPRQQDYIEINTDGSSTYNIDFTFVDSAIYANIHLYINYVSGSTINFVNGANTQWRFANGVAPVFSGTNRNIIVMSTWANDDVWEVSRSMYM
jgi:hypothetical protein